MERLLPRAFRRRKVGAVRLITAAGRRIRTRVAGRRPFMSGPTRRELLSIQRDLKRVRVHRSKAEAWRERTRALDTDGRKAGPALSSMD